MPATAPKIPAVQLEVPGITRVLASFTTVFVEFRTPRDARAFSNHFTVQFTCGTDKWFVCQPLSMGADETAIFYEIPEAQWERTEPLRMLATSRSTRNHMERVVPMFFARGAAVGEPSVRTASAAPTAPVRNDEFVLETLAGEAVVACMSRRSRRAG